MSDESIKYFLLVVVVGIIAVALNIIFYIKLLQFIHAPTYLFVLWVLSLILSIILQLVTLGD